MKPVQSNLSELLAHEINLLVRISKDDEGAFAELFHTYCLRLAPYVTKLLNSAFWAEEVIQDVFMKIWMNRKDLSCIDNPSAYIYRMAANKASDFLRKRSREIKLQYHITRRAADENTNFTEELTNFHFSEKLYTEAVNTLSAQRAQVYRMRHEEGMGYDDIKDCLHISKNTVRNHLVAAMEHIRNYILKHEEIILVLILSTEITLRNF